MRCSYFLFLFAVFFAVASIAAPFSPILNDAAALPFNQDMVGKQHVTGSIMRPKPENSVPVGALKREVPAAAEAAKLTNPAPKDDISVKSGKRLFEANCQVCHGSWKDGKHQPAVLPGIPSMDLTLDLYKGRSDGEIFSAVHHGKGLMPAYGWKFSVQEHWDLVNFVRSAQGK